METRKTWGRNEWAAYEKMMKQEREELRVQRIAMRAKLLNCPVAVVEIIETLEFQVGYLDTRLNTLEGQMRMIEREVYVNGPARIAELEGKVRRNWAFCE